MGEAQALKFSLENFSWELASSEATNQLTRCSKGSITNPKIDDVLILYGVTECSVFLFANLRLRAMCLRYEYLLYNLLILNVLVNTSEMRSIIWSSLTGN